jgi:hypothetical protein
MLGAIYEVILFANYEVEDIFIYLKCGQNHQSVSFLIYTPC